MEREPDDGNQRTQTSPVVAITMSWPAPAFRFPFPQPLHKPSKRAPGSAATGHKACTLCGTSRTPQWREGPAGPKTLCNACGVKLVRKNRAALEAQRRAAGLGPPPKGTPLRHILLAPEDPAYSGGGGWSDADAAAVTGGIARGGEPTKRPQRKAAALAAERTAEFASTGDWPQKVGGNGGVLLSLPKPQDSGASAASLQCSDAAEEVAWPPAHMSEMGGPLPRGLLQESTSAAVDLLTMTAQPSTPGQTEAAAWARIDDPSRPSSAPHMDMDAGAAHQEEAIQAARHAEAVAPTTSAGAQLSADERLVEHYLRAHLSSKTPLLDGMIAEAVDSWHTCSAADAAVAAVAKVLAQKQAAAIRARAAVMSSRHMLSSFLHAVDDQHQIVRAHKRQRHG